MLSFHDLMLPNRPPVSQDALAKLNQDSPVVVPTQLLELLLVSDGAYFIAGAVLNLLDKSTNRSLYVLDALSMIRTTFQLLEHSEKALLWAGDGSGNYLSVDADGICGFWDHDTGEIQDQEVRLEHLASRIDIKVEMNDEGRVPLPNFSQLNPTERRRFLAELVEDDRVDDVHSLVAEDQLSARDLLKLLHRSGKYGARKVLAYALELIGDPNARLKAGGDTPLMAAASGGQMGCVIALIEFGADPALKTSRGENAYRVARLCMQYPVAEYLRQFEVS